jgi:hypothetical protein
MSTDGWSPARLAYGFYGVAACGAVIGQTWVAVTHVPWSPSVPTLARLAAVLPFALCLELLAMALAAMADQRMRLGERAYGFRVFSALVAVVAVGILIVGHWPHYYWSAAFGVLSSSAYLLWLLHSSARRRDTLRATGQLATTAPDYGLWRRLRHPAWTARAAELARQGTTNPTGTWRPLDLFESLHAAQLAIRADQRRPALASAVATLVRAGHRDRHLAEIAVRTLDLDRLASELADRVDYSAWADRLTPAITPPPSPTDTASRAEDSPTPPAAPSAVEETAEQGRIGPDTWPPTFSLAPSPPPDPDRRDDEDQEDQWDSYDGDMNVDSIANDLVPLLPAARAARDQLLHEGRPVSRDTLATELRRNGHPIRTSRVSELLHAVRRDPPQPSRHHDISGLGRNPT